MWRRFVLLLSCLGFAHSRFTAADWISAFSPLEALNLDEVNFSSLDKKEIPQMVLFTYTGSVDKQIRDALTKVFPDDIRNPNDCSVGITLFVEGDGTDPCAVHRMYVRGHEIGSSAVNHTLAHFTWETRNWTSFYQSHRQDLTNTSFLDKNHVQGIRARSLILNGNVSFMMLHEQHFLYDSSLVVQQPREFSDIRSDIWPIYSDFPLTNLNTKNKKVWLLPVNPICDPPYRARVYLDDCKVSKKDEVLNLLKANFWQFYQNDRAPFQVNFRRDAVLDDDLRRGLRSFVDWLAGIDDVWLVTHQEAIEWMKAPTKSGEARGLSECGILRDYKTGCAMHTKNSSMAPFADVIRTEDLWIYQTFFLVVSYLGCLTYDRFKHQKKK